MRRLLNIPILFLLTWTVLTGQDKGKKILDTLRLEDFEIITSIFYEGETIPHKTIEEVVVFPRKKFTNRWQAWKYNRLISNIKKVYPYAKLARQKLTEMDLHIATLTSAKDKRRYIQQMEEELFSEFEDDLKKLTFTQGRLLIKLIDRETGDTTYEWVKEFKGSVSAFFWQAIARIFGSNLKSEFDAEGQDRIIDEIINMIDSGIL